MTLCGLTLFGVFCTVLEDTVAVVFLLDVIVHVTFLFCIGLLCFCVVCGKIFDAKLKESNLPGVWNLSGLASGVV